MNVTVFSSSSCAICHAEMKWLDSQNVKYDSIVVDEDEGGMEKMMEASGGIIQGTPFTVIDTGDATEKIAGFDRSRLTKILAL